MNPVSETQLQQDFTALVALFQIQPYATSEELEIIANPHASPSQLMAMGWIAERAHGRWSKLYVPAGAVASQLSTLNSQRAA